MRLRLSPLLLPLRLTLLLLLAPALLSAQTRRALLIGIDTYQPRGTVAQHTSGCAYGRCALGRFENLEGAVNDAQSMADLLTSPKFGFPADQVVLLTNPAPRRPRPGVAVLPSAQTDRLGILAAMQRYLVDLPLPGDTVVFYDASHGSLRVNSQGDKITVLMNGKLLHADSTLVPADAFKGGFDIRDREMTRIFNAALDKGIHLTAIFDSCHSGGVTRGDAQPYRARSLLFDPRDANEPPDLLPSGLPRPAPTERKDNPALVFSAAQQDQEADEADPTPAHPEAHGAFTAALVEALQVLPADAPATLVYQRVRAVLEGNSFTSQEPDLDATAARRQQPLFGAPSPAAGPAGTTLRAAALSTGSDGRVWLDIGRVAGIGVGSEFASMIKNSSGETVTLRIAELEGIARSSAEVVAPAGAKVAPGEVFELAKWVPADSAPLRLWLWPALPQKELLAAAAQIQATQIQASQPKASQTKASQPRASPIALISDPAEEPWTDMLLWDGASWVLRHAAPGAPATGIPIPGPADPAAPAPINLDRKPTAPIRLGPRLTTRALRQHLSAGARLWVNLPPSRELAAKLTLHDPGSAVQAAPDLAAAQYILAGSLSADGPTYAWFHRTHFDAGPRPQPAPGPASSPAPGPAPDHSPGCSTTSQYPVRSDWVPLAGPAQLDASAAALNRYASLLAKVHGWLELADNPTGASADAYYKLALVFAPARAPTPASAPAPAPASALANALAPAPGQTPSPSPALTPIPPGQSAQQDDQLQLALRADAPVSQRRWVYVLDIDCHGRGSLLYPRDYAENQFPSDADTGLEFVLPGRSTIAITPPFGLDTLVMLSTAQPLPDPYELEFDGVTRRGGLSPLERLLTGASHATRGAPAPVPTDWGLDLTTLRSIPKPAPPPP